MRSGVAGRLGPLGGVQGGPLGEAGLGREGGLAVRRPFGAEAVFYLKS